MITKEQIKFYSYLNPLIRVGGLLYFEEELALLRLKKEDIEIFEDVNPTISRLATHTSGGYLEFKTNSTFVDIKVNLTHSAYLPHMTAIAQAGFCLYIKLNGKWIFLDSSKVDKKEFIYRMIEGLDSSNKLFRLYFPLYVGVEDIEIGLEGDATLEKMQSQNKDKILCYGTSISQGASASRAGLSYSNILTRTTNYDVYNFGFSGSAQLEIEMANIIANVPDLKALTIEVSANAGQSENLYNRFEDFIDRIYASYPDLPILLISPFLNPHQEVFDKVKRTKERNIAFYQKMLIKYPKITYLDMEPKLSQFLYEDTVDAVHLNDLSFFEIAREVKKWLDKVL